MQNEIEIKKLFQLQQKIEIMNSLNLNVREFRKYFSSKNNLKHKNTSFSIEWNKKLSVCVLFTQSQIKSNEFCVCLLLFSESECSSWNISAYSMPDVAFLRTKCKTISGLSLFRAFTMFILMLLNSFWTSTSNYPMNIFMHWTFV